MLETKKTQRYTSAGTSINKNKLPVVFSKIAFTKGSTVLDYGCGRYIDHIRAKVTEQGCKYYPYDPYNLPSSKLPESKVTYGICSNVLNVIAEDNIIEDIIKTVCEKSEIAYFTVYEGDRSGVGKVTGKDSYQRNAKTMWYATLMKKMGYNNVLIYKNVIQVKGETVA